MPIRNASEVVEFDGDAALDAALEAVGGTLYSLVEYDSTGFRPLYVDDATLSFYESPEHMHEHFEAIHSHVNLDFTEVDLFTESLFPVADEVRYMTTSMDYMKLVRIYRDREGLFVALDADESVAPVVRAVESAVAGE